MARILSPDGLAGWLCPVGLPGLGNQIHLHLRESHLSFRESDVRPQYILELTVQGGRGQSEPVGCGGTKRWWITFTTMDIIENIEPHFLIHSGTAGMYNTDESSLPLCSLSTACTVSQCPNQSVRISPARHDVVQCPAVMDAYNILDLRVQSLV